MMCGRVVWGKLYIVVWGSPQVTPKSLQQYQQAKSTPNSPTYQKLDNNVWVGWTYSSVHAGGTA